MPRLIISAAAVITAAAAFCQTPSYLALADSAANYIGRERWADAERCITTALRAEPANPSNPMLFSNLGVCQHNQGEYAKALQSYSLALVKAPDSPRVLFNRARTLLAIRQDSEALSDLDHALRSDSTMTDALRLRATMLLALDSVAPARHDFSLLRELDPSDAWASAGLAECLAAGGDNVGATRLYTEALSKDPDPDTAAAAILHLLKEDHTAQAEEAIYQQLKKYPQEGLLYLCRAILHQRMFQNQAAESDKNLAKNYGIDSQTIERYFAVYGRKN